MAEGIATTVILFSVFSVQPIVHLIGLSIVVVLLHLS